LAISYFRPENLDEALALMQGRALTVLAGGTDVFPARGRLPVERDILDITGLKPLTGITGDGTGAVRIGACATWSEVLRADLPPAFDGLKQAARQVGGAQIQNAGTVAGNLCNASPAADGVPPLLTLRARVEVASVAGRREIPLQDFILGPRQIALQPGELVSALIIPPPEQGMQGAFEKLGARRYLVISIVMSAVVIRLDSAGRIDLARVAVGACSAVACRLAALERDMLGQRPCDLGIAPAHLAPLAPIDDVRADAGYRLHAVSEQIRRAVTAAEQAHG